MTIDTLYDEKRSSPSSSWLNLRYHDHRYLIRREERLWPANGHVRSTAGGIVLMRKYFYMMMRYSHMMIWWNMLIWRDCVAHTHSCSWRQNHKCDNLQPSMSIWHQDQSGGEFENYLTFFVLCRFRRSTIQIHKEYKLLRFCNRGLRRLLHQSSHLETVAMALSWVSNMTRGTALTNCPAVFWKCLI